MLSRACLRVKDENQEYFKIRRYGIKEALAKQEFEAEGRTAADRRFNQLQKLGAKSGMMDQFNKTEDEDDEATANDDATDAGEADVADDAADERAGAQDGDSDESSAQANDDGGG